MSSFRLTMFPADDGDCLLLSFGRGTCDRHILVDGGRRRTAAVLLPALVEIGRAGGSLDLMVLSHIDADHIEGMLALIEKADIIPAPRDVWFNGCLRPEGLRTLSARQGDAYSDRLKELGWPVNAAFGGDPVVAAQPPATLGLDGLKVTMLSPSAAGRDRLQQHWGRWRDGRADATSRGVDLRPDLRSMGGDAAATSLDIPDLCGPTPADTTVPNGSSIAFIAEWQGRTVLLAGDAHSNQLSDAIQPLAAAAGGRLPIDLFKLSHHGIHANTSRRLVELLDCSRFAVSTSGMGHGHPDPQSLARILAFGNRHDRSGKRGALGVGT